MYIHTHIHTYIQTHAHTHIHIHTHDMYTHSHDKPKQCTTNHCNTTITSSPQDVSQNHFYRSKSWKASVSDYIR